MCPENLQKRQTVDKARIQFSGLYPQVMSENVSCFQIHVCVSWLAVEPAAETRSITVNILVPVIRFVTFC